MNMRTSRSSTRSSTARHSIVGLAVQFSTRLIVVALAVGFVSTSHPVFAQESRLGERSITDSVAETPRQRRVDREFFDRTVHRSCFCLRRAGGHLVSELGLKLARPTPDDISFPVAAKSLRQCCSFEETGVELEAKGVWGGKVHSVFVDEANPNRAYVASGRRLVILDVVDNGAGGLNLNEIGSIDLQSLVLDVQVRDNYAYVAVGSIPNAFSVVDVSNPTQPQLVWSNGSQVGADRSSAIHLYNDLVYIQNGDDLNVYDITDPENPEVLNQVVPSIVEDATIVGDNIYVVTGPPIAKEIHIYEIIDSFTVSLLGSAPLPGNSTRGTSIEVDGNFAYTTTKDDDGSFAVTDVSDPTNPIVLGSLVGDFQSANDIAANGSIVYVADPEGSFFGSQAQGLAIIDVSNPQAPVILDSFRTHSSAINMVKVVGNRAFVADEGEGLLVLDISTANAPTRLGNYYSPAFLGKMDKVGSLLYITDRFNGISIISVANPDAPQLISSYQTSDGAIDSWGIDVRGGMAYLAAGRGGIEVANVSNPVNPVLAGSLPFVPGLQAMALELSPTSNIAFVGVTFGFVVSFDVSDPTNIFDVGQLDIGGGAPFIYDIHAASTGLAHAARDLAAVAFEVSDPASPFVLSTTPMQAKDLAVVGNHRYVAEGSADVDIGGIYAQDISDPVNPVHLSRFPALRATGVDANGDKVYFVGQDLDNGGRNSLFALDMSDPTTPAVLDTLFVPTAQQVFVDGANIYVTGIESGLAVFKARVLGDINCDGLVNLADYDQFNICLAGPLQPAAPACADPEAADCDSDGDVDVHDYAMFSGMFDSP